ncbi:zinc finger BED domain-containing protein 5-like [Metopolophium dirhodum]|uniref:zinc finger BED domain-containing protein 5-like n=1 Tax=Metopolophium dirhodum TaxID=44670 RepID=UPI00298FB7ED|nr:zinc finger BED domain-containing protein 5-like [Metopolophium dirhodum]XP_060860481.1 zinc finger BED domain-containing protein 5-like [Metopolophium dirhodum]
MDSWLKTGRLASGKNVLACSPAENNENISEIDVSSLSDLVNTGQERQNKLVSEIVLPEERTTSKKRKYDESYLSFGFIPVRMAENPDGQCVCNKIMCNSSLVPAKLRRHLDTNHPQLKDKSLSFFERHKEVQKTGVAALQKYAKTDNENGTEASFMLSYRIARAGKPHTIAEDLIKPCMTVDRNRQLRIR